MEARPVVLPVGGEEVEWHLGPVDQPRLGKTRCRELIRVGCTKVRKMKPEGEVEGSAIRATGDEDSVEDAELSGNLDRPSEEHICDDAGRWATVLLGDV